ncbi:two-component system sensor histidine kinase NtrB [Alicyclobacillus mali (ex Roth et al. 2021)]|uniref:two-component system sensor histidine kinase NtrB n=1 Tax=Alicyclobacillus mali (ex Roth et al. 2021) TaxID=1123961 RepID=UPI00082BA905|nr:PAS domain-containing sensor histidine kinase [Alicyclobacillus mali (ex Roth et al. 2021)]MCL6488473.1 PAS domain-containing sensor histidine kinase [Alicyclobacillus mali (ex Roth et al. 2021)]
MNLNFRRAYPYALLAAGLTVPFLAAWGLYQQTHSLLWLIIAVACVLEFFPIHLPGGRQWSTSAFCYVWAANQLGFAAATTAILFSVTAAFLRSVEGKLTAAHVRHLLISLGAHQLALVPAYVALHRALFVPYLFRSAVAAMLFELVRLAVLTCLHGSMRRLGMAAAALRSLHPVALIIPPSLASLLSARNADWSITLPTAALFFSFVWISRVHSRLVDECESARQTYRVIAENSADLVLVAASSGEITFASPGFLASAGLDRESLLGRSVFDLVAPEDFSRFDDLFTPIGADGQEHDFALEIDGVRADVALRLTPIRTNAAHAGGYILQARDLAPRLRKEATRLREGRLEAAGQLAASIAHEFRNPLTTVMGFVQLFRPQFDELAPGAYEAIWGELERMKDVTDSLMVLARPEAVKPIPCDLAEMARAAIGVCDPLALERGVPLDLGPLPRVQVLGYPGQLRQMVVHLLRNAIEAAAETHGRVVLWITATEAEATVHIRDTGPGIPDSVLEHLGEPMYNTEMKGTGLGLMVVHRIVQQHGGEIHIWRTEEPTGTAVEVRLPTYRG